MAGDETRRVHLKRGIRGKACNALLHCLSSSSVSWWALIQWRRKQIESGVHMASAEREPIRGSGGRAPSGAQGQSQTLLQPTNQPWSGGQGGEAPLKLKSFRHYTLKGRQYLPLYPTFESAEISPKHCLELK